MSAKQTKNLKKQCLSLAELSKIDDIAKYLVLDPFLKFQVQKMQFQNVCGYIVCEDDLLFKVIDKFIISEYDLLQTKDFLKNCVCFDEEKILEINLERHLLNYLSVIQPDSIVKVEQCDRYKSSIKQVKVVANKDFKQKENIKILNGSYATLTSDDKSWIENSEKDFSIMYSTLKKCTVLLLGPVALVNHDCDANCKYTVTDCGVVFLITTKKIKKQEEITVNYGDHYFDDENQNCECKTCEKNGKGAFCNGQRSCVNIEPGKNSLDEQQIQLPISCNTLNTADNIIANAKNFQNLINKLKMDTYLFDNSCQRKINMTDSKGLAYDNSLYQTFILVLRLDMKEQVKLNDLNPSPEDVRNIVEKVYKNIHKSSFNAVEKFMQNYKDTIITDAKGDKDVNTLLAPKCKEMQEYVNKLVIICISECFQEFALCIYQNKKLSPDLKKAILKKMHDNQEPTKQQKSKLDNYLNMYNMYLQKVAENFLCDLLKNVTPIEENIQIQTQNKMCSSSLEKVYLSKEPEQDLTYIETLITNQDQSLQDSVTNVSRTADRNSITAEVETKELSYSTTLDDSLLNESSILKQVDSLTREKIHEIIGVCCSLEHETKNIKESTNDSKASSIGSSDSTCVRHNTTLSDICERELKVVVPRLAQEEIHYLTDRTNINTNKHLNAIRKRELKVVVPRLAQEKIHYLEKKSSVLTTTLNGSYMDVSKKIVNDKNINMNKHLNPEYKYNTVVRESCDDVLSTNVSTMMTETNRSVIPEERKSGKKFQKGTLSENILAVMNSIELYLEDSNDEMICLFKKLVLLNFLEGNCEMEKYMTYRKVSSNTKTKILRLIYDNDYQEVNYTHLDFLIPQRYLIRRQYAYLENLLKGKITKNLNVSQSFKDFENIFYEEVRRATYVQ